MPPGSGHSRTPPHSLARPRTGRCWSSAIQPRPLPPRRPPNRSSLPLPRGIVGRRGGSCSSRWRPCEEGAAGGAGPVKSSHSGRTGRWSGAGVETAAAARQRRLCHAFDVGRGRLSSFCETRFVVGFGSCVVGFLETHCLFGINLRSARHLLSVPLSESPALPPSPAQQPQPPSQPWLQPPPPPQRSVSPPFPPQLSP